MLFNSITFILFFIIVLIIHYSPINWRFKKISLLIGSYIFYAAWNPAFVILLFLSTFADWHLAKKIFVCEHKSQRKRWLVLSLIFNLGLLSIFKYSGFLLDNVQSILHLFGINSQFTDPGIILPMGISFYTFQTLSYTLDVYSKKLKPANSFLDYSLFVSFFPQLVAGPIVRARDFLPQLKHQHHISFNVFSIGISLFIIGLFEKTVLADAMFAPIVNEVFVEGTQPDMLSAWLGGWFFYGQIFCDFAGYSLCAIGCALCLGFKLPLNFRSPFAALGFADLWRRWHISLSSWLRDYLYIALGGNKIGRYKTLRNLMITMVLGGLWHGAAWTFIIWGILHGLYLVIERGIKQIKFLKNIGTYNIIRYILIFITFLFVMLAFVIFRADNVNQAMQIYAGMIGLGETRQIITWNLWIQLATLTFITLTLIQWIFRSKDLIEVIQSTSVITKSVVLSFLLIMIITSSGNSDAFIYFQF